MNELVLDAASAFRAAKSELLSREAAYSSSPDEQTAREVQVAMANYEHARTVLREQTRR